MGRARLKAIKAQLMKIEITLEYPDHEIYCLDTGDITFTNGDKIITSIRKKKRCSMMIFFFLGDLMSELTDLRAAKNMRKYQIGPSDFPFIMNLQKIGKSVVISSSGVSFDYDFDKFCSALYSSIKSFLSEWDSIIDPEDSLIRALRNQLGKFDDLLRNNTTDSSAPKY
jgi:hypothetical protein